MSGSSVGVTEIQKSSDGIRISPNGTTVGPVDDSALFECSLSRNDRMIGQPGRLSNGSQRKAESFLAVVEVANFLGVSCRCTAKHRAVITLSISRLDEFSFPTDGKGKPDYPRQHPEPAVTHRLTPR